MRGLLCEGENTIEVLVYNTLANHFQTIPSRYRGSPESGLLGPVRLVFHDYELYKAMLTRVVSMAGTSMNPFQVVTKMAQAFITCVPNRWLHPIHSCPREPVRTLTGNGRPSSPDPEIHRLRAGSIQPGGPLEVGAPPRRWLLRSRLPEPGEVPSELRASISTPRLWLRVQ